MAAFSGGWPVGLVAIFAIVKAFGARVISGIGDWQRFKMTVKITNEFWLAHDFKNA